MSENMDPENLRLQSKQLLSMIYETCLTKLDPPQNESVLMDFSNSFKGRGRKGPVKKPLIQMK